MIRRYHFSKLTRYKIIVLVLWLTAFSPMLVAGVVYGSATCNGNPVSVFSVKDRGGKVIVPEVRTNKGVYRINLPRGRYVAVYDGKPRDIRSSSQARQQNIEFCR